jgi:arsenate reductase (glutaredoxin)
MLTLYTYAKCSTCRAATAYLKRRGVPFAEKPIREQPPTLPELRAMLSRHGEVRKLFNTSGRDYRELGLGATLKTLSQAQALRLLAGNGNLVKRPFVPLAGGGLVGFKEEEWDRCIAAAKGR